MYTHKTNKNKFKFTIERNHLIGKSKSEMEWETSVRLYLFKIVIACWFTQSKPIHSIFTYKYGPSKTAINLEQTKIIKGE